MSVPYVITDKQITVYVNGEPYMVPRGWDGYPDLVELLAAEEPDLDAIKEHLTGYDPSLSIVYVSSVDEGRIQVTRSAVFFDGEQVNSALARRMVDIVNSGLPVDPWIKFMAKIYANPAEYARDELYQWVETSDLPITSDGDFLAYKLVRHDFKDIYTGTMDNSPGQTVVMPGGRQAVDTDRNRTCSTGLHFCSKEYLPAFGLGRGSDKRCVLVKVNPADVVSIPSDYNNQKGRTWQYTVIQEVPNPLYVRWPEPVVTTPEDEEWDDVEDFDDYEGADPAWFDWEDGDPDPEGEQDDEAYVATVPVKRGLGDRLRGWMGRS